MGRRTRAVGFVALIAFLGVTAWSAGVTPSPCCSTGCEKCPVTFCKGTDAISSPRADLGWVGSHILGTPPLPARLEPELIVSDAPRVAVRAFRPMRN